MCVLKCVAVAAPTPHADGEGRKVTDSLLAEPELFSGVLPFRWKSADAWSVCRPGPLLRRTVTVWAV